MKRIKKLRLINWHFFEDQTINFSAINAITGENGTGKSTIIDAIHYVISGGTCSFNAAANTFGSGRTVENYLKGRTGIEGHEFLRDSGDVIGHIAIEFFDDHTGKPFILGCVIQLVSNTLNGPFFYQIQGSSWSDNLFFENKDTVRNFDSLLKESEIEKIDLKPIGNRRDSKEKRKKNVLDALGVPNKYETLFTKAISFEPLQEISRFATDFLLPESKLDLSTIKETMEAYRRLQSELNSENNRAIELKPIFDNYQEYESIQKEIFALDILLIDSNIQISKRKINSDDVGIEKEKGHQKQFELDEANARKNSASYSLSAANMENSKEYNEVKRLESDKEKAQDEIDSGTKNVKRFEDKLRAESVVAKSLGTSIDFESAIKTQNFDSLRNIISSYLKRIRDIKEKTQTDLVNLSVDKNTLSEKRKPIFSEYSKLKAGEYGYPDCVNQLEDAINKKIKEQTGVPSVPMYPLCSELSINDPDWAGAIEGLLGKRRFDLLISPQYAKIGLQCFNSKPELSDYFGVGVITSNCQQASNVSSDAIYKKIDSFRNDANNIKHEIKESRDYIDEILGDIHCVSSIHDFKIGVKAVTKEGVYFDGVSVRFLLKEDMDKPYIGQDAKKRRLNADEKAIADIDSKIKNLDEQIREYNRILEIEAGISLRECVSGDNPWYLLKVAKGNLSDIEKRLSDLQNENPDLLNLSSKIQELKRKADEENTKANNANNNKASSIRAEQKFEDEKVEQSESIKRNEESKKQRMSNPGFDLAGFDELLSSLAGGLTCDKLRDSVSMKMGPIVEKKMAVEGKIRGAINSYCLNHPNELTNDISCYMTFVERYNKIVNDDLAKLNPEVEAAYEKSKQELREHFISRIRASLTEAQYEVASLNRTLARHPFGNDKEVFEFSSTKNTDELLGEIYRIAMDTKQDLVDSIVTDAADQKTKDIMRRVLDILSSNEDDPKCKEQRAQLLDYRNYFHYDIKIKMSDGNVLLYSKNENSKSGGETQTPFYAIIAGAFQSLLAGPEKNGYSPCGLVIFDEAFNNMDGERISQMLGFYKELQIQLIISVPPNRFGDISPYADNIIGLAKAGESAAVYDAMKDKNEPNN